MRPEPTWIIYSGRGIWLIWQLDEPAEVDGKDGLRTLAVEERGIYLEEQFGTQWINADHCRNIDRIARLPGTVNWKTAQTARVICADFDKKVTLEELPRVSKKERRGTPERGEIPEEVPWIDLGKLDISDDLKQKITQPDWAEFDDDKSRCLHRVNCELIRADVADADIVAIMLHYPIGEHVRKKPLDKQRDYAVKQLEGALAVQSRPGPVVSKQDHYRRAETWRDSNRPNQVLARRLL